MNVARRGAALLLLIGLLLSTACSGGRADEPDPAPPQAPVQSLFTRADGALVRGLSTATLHDEARGIHAEVPTFASARQLTVAVGVLRERALREASWAGAPQVRTGWQLVASGQGVLGVLFDPGVTPAPRPSGAPAPPAAEQSGSQPAMAWFDAASGQVSSSPVLIAEDRWGDFKNAVSSAAGPVDPVALSRTLDAAPAPQGSGPVLGFGPTGELVAAFAPGTVTGTRLVVRIPAEQTDRLLSDLGRRAQAASVAPGPFDGSAPAGTTSGPDTPPPGAPSASPHPTSPHPASPTASNPPPESQPPVNQPPRPATTLGPDCARSRCVALTFDDGPGPQTAEVLEALRQNRAAATFFQLGGQAQAHPDLALRVASSGQEVGNGTWSHAQLTGLSRARLAEEVNRTADTLAQLQGRRPMLLRPSYGAHNKSVDEAAAALDSAEVLWNVDTADWQHRDPQKIRAEAVRAADQPGSIVLLHDIQPATARAVGDIVTGLRERGVNLVTVSELSLDGRGYQPGRAYCAATWFTQPTPGCSR